MTTTRRFFSGDSLEQAIMQAARHHHLLPDQVAYKVIEKRHGFLKIRRGVVISVDPASPGKGEEAEAPPAEVETTPVETSPPVTKDEPQAPPETDATPERSPRKRSRKSSKESQERSPAKGDGEVRQVAPWHLADEDDEATEPEPEREPVVEAALVVTEEPETEDDRPEEGPFDEEGDPAGEDPGDDESWEEASDEGEEKFELVDDMAQGAREAVEQLLEFVDIEGMSIEVGEGEDRLEVKLSGEGQDRLLEDRGALLLAVEHMVPRLLRGILGRSAPCRVDCGGFHEDREQRLGDLATDAADEARRRQRPKTLAPMSPEERRIVHMSLADDPDVRTESQGRGFFKRVTVSPVRHRSRVFD